MSGIRFLPRLSGFLYFLNKHVIILKTTTYDDPTCSGCFPDVRIRFFGQKSGFLKTSFLKTALLKKLFDIKFFPDKIRPGSGFALKCPVYQIYLNITYRYVKNHVISHSPISRIPLDIRIRILIFHCFTRFIPFISHLYINNLLCEIIV